MIPPPSFDDAITWCRENSATVIWDHAYRPERGNGDGGAVVVIVVRRGAPQRVDALDGGWLDEGLIDAVGRHILMDALAGPAGDHS